MILGVAQVLDREHVHARGAHAHDAAQAVPRAPPPRTRHATQPAVPRALPKTHSVATHLAHPTTTASTRPTLRQQLPLGPAYDNSFHSAHLAYDNSFHSAPSRPSTAATPRPYPNNNTQRLYNPCIARGKGATAEGVVARGALPRSLLTPLHWLAGHGTDRAARLRQQDEEDGRDWHAHVRSAALPRPDTGATPRHTLLPTPAASLATAMGVIAAPSLARRHPHE